jgi:hypothetical protein
MLSNGVKMGRSCPQGGAPTDPALRPRGPVEALSSVEVVGQRDEHASAHSRIDPGALKVFRVL